MNKYNVPEIDFDELPNPLQKFIEEEGKRRNKLIEDFIAAKLGMFIKLPKFILKKLYALEIKNSFNPGGGVEVYTFRNKLTRKKSTLVIESAIFNNQK